MKISLMGLFSVLCFGTYAFAASEPALSTDVKWPRCSVVEVGALNSNLFEEGLGSIYDFSDDGFSGADSDSVVAGVDISSKGMEVQLGQMRWESANTKMTATASMVDGDVEERVVEVKIKNDKDTMIIRLFTTKKIGRVTYKKARSKDAEFLALFDCSGLKDLRDR